MLANIKNSMIHFCNTKIVRDVRMGDNGIFANAKKGCLIIDSSTISPTDTKEMTNVGEKLGFRIADVPISGGYMGAKAGTLTCIVGCRKEDYDEVNQVYSCMGKNIFYCGEPGAGQSAKICNNLGLAIQNISVAEALSLGEKLGVDLHVLAKIMSLSTGMCWAVKVNTPVPGFDKSLPASNNYDHGFEVNLMKKDVSLVLDEAKKVDLDLQFAQKSYEYYKDAEDKGMGKKDISIMFQHLKHFTISKK